jgi:osmotically-inducible protein OsmY
MKTRIAAAVASLVIASLGTAAYAQTTPPSSTTSAYPTNTAQPNSMNNNMSNMSNSQTEQKIKQELTSNGITATNVNVSFSDGTATLSGTVATQRDIAKARMEAMRVHGVKHVDTSNLQARSQTGMQH